MNIYYNIKSPIQSDKGLRKIVDAYLSDGKGRGESFYGKAVSYGVKEEEFDKEEFSAFKRKIDSMEFDRIRKLDEGKVKKYSLAKKNFVLNTLLEIIIGRREAVNYPNYQQYKLVMKYSNDEILNRYQAIKNGKVDELSKEDRTILDLIDEYLIVNKHVFRGLAGYHIYADTFEDYAEIKEEQKYKIYLNLPYKQLYKFAEKYMEICKDKKIAYTFKVMSPLADRPDRAERICIYCEKDTFYQTIDIIRAIKSANPELSPEEPPIMAGVLDGWIGIGSDPENQSYNQYRASCIETALNKYFDGIPKEEARRMVKNNPQILSEIRDAIEQEARDMRIATTKFCFTQRGNMSIKEHDNNYQGRDFKIDHRMLRIEGLEGGNKHRSNGMDRKPKKRRNRSDRFFDEYAQTRMQYGNESQEMQDLLNRIARDCEAIAHQNNGHEDWNIPKFYAPNNNKKSQNRKQQYNAKQYNRPAQNRNGRKNNYRGKEKENFSPFEL